MCDAILNTVKGTVISIKILLISKAHETWRQILQTRYIYFRYALTNLNRS